MAHYQHSAADQYLDRQYITYSMDLQILTNSMCCALQQNAATSPAENILQRILLVPWPSALDTVL
jgi:hypothetical protein